MSRSQDDLVHGSGSSGARSSQLPSGIAAGGYDPDHIASEFARGVQYDCPQLVADRRHDASSPPDIQQTMKRGPMSSALSGLPAMDTSPSSSKAHPPQQQHQLQPTRPVDTSLTAKRTRKIARKLLALVACSACQRPCNQPVTLPCGHSTCMSCIKTALRDAMSNNSHAGPSRATYVPPRLPLCSITIPCSVAGCPRSAIGRGLGMWAGYSASFGPPEGDAWVDVDDHPGDTSTDVSGEAGVLPVDGFVVGAQNESLRLGVIPAQPRDKANVFALHPFPMDDGHTSMELTLRPDVTLAKTIAVLQRYAKEPPGTSMSRGQQPMSSQRARRPLRGFASARRMTTSTYPAFQSGSRVSHSHRQMAAPSSSRPGATAIDPRFRAILGGSEAYRESGTMDGVRATNDTDDEDSTPPPPTSYYRRFARGYEDDEVDDESVEADDAGAADTVDMDEDYEDMDVDSDDDDDDFGGAFARPRQPRGYGEEAERQRLQRYRGRLGASSSGLVRQWDGEQQHDAKDEGDVVARTMTSSSSLGSSPTDNEAPKMLTPEHLQSDLVDTLECQLCYMLLYQPLTTPCGHTFCRVCFARSLDHSSNCPLCRASMPSFSFFQDHPLNQGLMNILNSHLGAPDSPDATKSRDAAVDDDDDADGAVGAYPQEDLLSMSRLGVFADSHRLPSDSTYHAKWRETREDEDDEATAFGLRRLYQERAQSVEREEEELSQWVPIFVCTLTFPGMPTNLHIFEPRYRLMIRRCLQSKGPSRFGMVLPSRQVGTRTPGLAEYGTMLEIKSCQMLLDGRSMLETVGWRRFRLLEAGSLDGYTTGRIEYVDDDDAQVQAAEEVMVLQSNARRHREQEERHRPRGDEDTAMVDELQSRADPYVARAATLGSGARVRASAGAREGSPPSVVLPPLGNEGQQHGDSGDTTEQQAPLQQPTLSELINTCVGFIEMLRTQTAPGLFDQIVTTYGPVPHPLETDKLGWWLGMVLPIDEMAKSTLLPVRSPRRRLEMIVGWIERIQAEWRPHA